MRIYPQISPLLGWEEWNKGVMERQIINKTEERAKELRGSGQKDER